MNNNPTAYPCEPAEEAILTATLPSDEVLEAAAGMQRAAHLSFVLLPNCPLTAISVTCPPQAQSSVPALETPRGTTQ